MPARRQTKAEKYCRKQSLMLTLSIFHSISQFVSKSCLISANRTLIFSAAFHLIQSRDENNKNKRKQEKYVMWRNFIVLSASHEKRKIRWIFTSIKESPNRRCWVISCVSRAHTCAHTHASLIFSTEIKLLYFRFWCSQFVASSNAVVVARVAWSWKDRKLINWW